MILRICRFEFNYLRFCSSGDCPPTPLPPPPSPHQNAVIYELTSVLILFEVLSETSRELGETQKGELRHHP